MAKNCFRRVALAGALALVAVKVTVARMLQRSRPMWRSKFRVAAALALGTVLATAAFVAGPRLTAAAITAQGFVVALAVGVVLRLRRLLAADGMNG